MMCPKPECFSRFPDCNVGWRASLHGPHLKCSTLLTFADQLYFCFEGKLLEWDQCFCFLLLSQSAVAVVLQPICSHFRVFNVRQYVYLGLADTWLSCSSTPWGNFIPLKTTLKNGFPPETSKEQLRLFIPLLQPSTGHQWSYPMLGPLERHISLPNSLEKWKGWGWSKGTLLFGEVSNFIPGLVCALNGLSPRGRDKKRMGYRCSWQKRVGIRQNKASTADSFFCCCCWTMRVTYLRVALAGTFSANWTDPTTVSRKGSI